MTFWIVATGMGGGAFLLGLLWYLQRNLPTPTKWGQDAKRIAVPTMWIGGALLVVGGVGWTLTTILSS